MKEKRGHFLSVVVNCYHLIDDYAKDGGPGEV